MHLLLVDDHAVVRSGIRDIVSLSAPEARFSEASTAHEAMERILVERFDMVVLDISLPDESGIELLCRIREIQPELPVLILSMHPEEGYALRAIQAGANGYLNKASVPAELVGAIRAVLAGQTFAAEGVIEELAKGVTNPVSPRRPHELLSEREWYVLRMLARGDRLTTIAEKLGVNPKTVSTYKSRIMRKLDVSNNADMMRYAISMGLAEY